MKRLRRTWEQITPIEIWNKYDSFIVTNASSLKKRMIEMYNVQKCWVNHIPNLWRCEFNVWLAWTDKQRFFFVFGPNQVKIPNKCRWSKQTTMPQNNTGPQHIRPTLRSSIDHFNLKGRLYLVCKTWEYLADREIRNESLIWTKAGQHGNVQFCSQLSEFCVIRLTELDSTHVQIGPNLILWFFR